MTKESGEMRFKSMDMSEKVSVIMGIYNCANTLDKAIDSIVAQTYINWELIMCDDYSNDNTYQVALSYVNQYSNKMILISNSKNSRLAFSLNHCLQYATGKYIARMDGDDISIPERFEKEIGYLRAHPDVNLVGTAMRRFSDSGLAEVVYGIDNPDRNSLRRKVPFNHATIMTYKYVYDKLGGYTVAERTKRSQDYDLWFRFYYGGFNGQNMKEPLYMVREDLNAIKRRTMKGRINEYKTTLIGFKMLNYPWHWYIRPTINLLKGFVPSSIILLYRKFQANMHKLYK